MKIDELNQQATAAYLTSVRNEKQPETTDTHGEPAAKQQPATDKVELSSYIPVASASRQQQDVRASRVEEVKAQIASGTYKVPGRAVAEKMLSKIVMPTFN